MQRIVNEINLLNPSPRKRCVAAKIIGGGFDILRAVRLYGKTGSGSGICKIAHATSTWFESTTVHLLTKSLRKALWGLLYLRPVAMGQNS